MKQEAEGKQDFILGCARDVIVRWIDATEKDPPEGPAAVAAFYHGKEALNNGAFHRHKMANTGRGMTLLEPDQAIHVLKIGRMVFRADIEANCSIFIEELYGLMETNICVDHEIMIQEIGELEGRIEFEQLLEIPAASLGVLKPGVNILELKGKGGFVDPDDLLVFLFALILTKRLRRNHIHPPRSDILLDGAEQGRHKFTIVWTDTCHDIPFHCSPRLLRDYTLSW